MFLVVSKYLIPKGYRGLTIFPFVFVKNHSDMSNEQFLNHERIHLQQQLEMLVIPFLIWYAIAFLVRLIQFKNWHVAYQNISFEREAYAKEKDLEYLKTRSFWKFKDYI